MRRPISLLRGALDALSSWPDAIREAVAGWLTPPPSPTKGNGADRDAPPPQPPPADASRATLTPPRRRAFVKPTAAEVREAKRALLAAMKAHPAAGTHELARLTGSRPPTVAERLRRLEGRGLIARDAGGKRRAVEARPT